MPKRMQLRRGSKYQSKRRQPRRDRKGLREYIRKVVRFAGEPKVACGTKSSTTLSASWAVLDTLNDIVAEGTGPNDRVGLKVNISGYKLKMAVSLAADRPQGMRLLVLRKKADFVNPGDLPGTTVNPMIGCITPEMRTKYDVLVDEIVNPPVLPDDTPSLFRVVYKEWWIPGGGDFRYDGPLGTDLDIGRVYIYAVTDNVAGGTDFIDLSFDWAMYYRDL